MLPGDIAHLRPYPSLPGHFDYLISDLGLRTTIVFKPFQNSAQGRPAVIGRPVRP
jgi:hypothetical protein